MAAVSQNPLVEKLETPLFVVGSNDLEYDGYRRVTEEDISNTYFQKVLIRFHNENNGFPIVYDINYYWTFYDSRFNTQHIPSDVSLLVGDGVLEINLKVISPISKSKSIYKIWEDEDIPEPGRNWRVIKNKLISETRDQPTLFVLLDQSIDPRQRMDRMIAASYQDSSPVNRNFSLMYLLSDLPLTSASVLAGDSSLSLRLLDPFHLNQRLGREFEQYPIAEFPPFKIGSYTQKYPFYRRMRKREFEMVEWREALLESHRMNDGWPIFDDVTISNFSVYRPLSILQHELEVNNKPLYPSRLINDRFEANYSYKKFGSEKDKNGQPLSVDKYIWSALENDKSNWEDEKRPCIFVYEYFNPVRVAAETAETEATAAAAATAAATAATPSLPVDPEKKGKKKRSVKKSSKKQLLKKLM